MLNIDTDPLPCTKTVAGLFTGSNSPTGLVTMHSYIPESFVMAVITVRVLKMDLTPNCSVMEVLSSVSLTVVALWVHDMEGMG